MKLKAVLALSLCLCLCPANKANAMRLDCKSMVQYGLVSPILAPFSPGLAYVFINWDGNRSFKDTMLMSVLIPTAPALVLGSGALALAGGIVLAPVESRLNKILDPPEDSENKVETFKDAPKKKVKENPQASPEKSTNTLLKSNSAESKKACKTDKDKAN